MGVNAFDVMSLGKAGLLDPRQASYKDSVEIIKDEFFKIKKSFVKIEWYMKHLGMCCRPVWIFPVHSIQVHQYL